MNLINLFIWSLGFFLTGFLVFIGTPLFIGPMLDREKRQRLGRIYGAMAAFAFQRFMLFRRKHGGHTLTATSYSGEKRAEEVELNGETMHYEDPNTQMKLFCNRKFGCAYEKSNIITSPSMADLARAGKEFVSNDQHVQEIRWNNPSEGAMTDGGQNVADDGYTRVFASLVRIPERHRFVDLADAFYAAPGSATPSDAKTSEEYTKLSQAGLKSANYMDIMLLLLAYGAGVLAFWALASQQGLGGVSGGVSLPMMVRAGGAVLGVGL